MEVLYKPLTANYKPNEVVAERLRQKYVTAVFGPSGGGKNALMRASRLTVVTSVTSRPEEPRDRSGGSAYRDFLKLRYSYEREDLLLKLIGGWFVQAIVNPANNEFYGSELQDYPDWRGVLDVTTTEYLKLREQRLFGKMRGVLVVPPSFGELNQRIRARNGGRMPADYIPRLREDAAGLAQTITQPEDVAVVVNDDFASATEQLTTVALGYDLSERQQAAGRRAAHAVLRDMQAELSHCKGG